MAVSENGARLWHALAMGPLWRERGAVPDGAAPCVPQAPAGPPEAAAGPAQGANDVGSMDWDRLEAVTAACTACPLSQSRTQAVFAAGSRAAQWMFIGEAPGAEEDARGEPFVGQAGRLLDNMLGAAGLGRDRAGAGAVFIANVLKCRPPANRNPEPSEVAACAPFLRRQIELLAPRIIVVMGRFAAQSLLATDASIASLRGRVHTTQSGGRRIPVVVTYHPAYLLRNLADKARSWEDLCLARETFEALGQGADASAG